MVKLNLFYLMIFATLPVMAEPEDSAISNPSSRFALSQSVEEQQESPMLVDNRHDEESDVFEISTGDTKKVGGRHAKSRQAAAKKSERGNVLRIHWDEKKTTEEALYIKPVRETKHHSLADDVLGGARIQDSKEVILNHISHEQNVFNALEVNKTANNNFNS